MSKRRKELAVISVYTVGSSGGSDWDGKKRSVIRGCTLLRSEGPYQTWGGVAVEGRGSNRKYGGAKACSHESLWLWDRYFIQQTVSAC